MPVIVNGLSCVLADGVRETTQTSDTNTYTLDGPTTVGGITYRSFVAGVGSGNRTVYCVRLGSQFEIGIGIVTSGTPATLTRDVILASSNGGNVVNWGSSTAKDIIIDVTSAILHSLQSQIDTVPFSRLKTTTFTASGTFTTDADTIGALVRGVGGGGAGGGAAATSGGAPLSLGSGGGGGEYAEGYFTAAQLGASKAVTIGPGGTGVSGLSGNNGGTTSLGSLITMFGGGGGAMIGPTNTDFIWPGGSGGSGGAGGFLRIPGSRGGPAFIRSAALAYLHHGGASQLGGSRTTNGLTEAGEVGQIYGGGGTGATDFFATTGGIARAGGAGAPGVLIVIEYLHV